VNEYEFLMDLRHKILWTYKEEQNINSPIISIIDDRIRFLIGFD
jgi:hypothetical protein